MSSKATIRKKARRPRSPPRPRPQAAKRKRRERAAGNLDDADIGRTDDPVRMYLREMGSVELLSREGEIAIAKRIEAGRDMMIGGIAESPLTYRALLDWRERLGKGEMLLRDIIDLDATYGGSPDPAAAAVAPPRARPSRASRPRSRWWSSRREGRGRGGRRSRRGGECLARRHGAGAPAQRDRDPRQDRRHLQEGRQAALQAAGDRRTKA